MKEIQNMPTSIDKVHESCYRSYHILIKVLEMVQRGDSKQTIAEVVAMLNSDSVETEKTKP